MAEQLSLQINVGGNVDASLGSLKKQLREAQAEVGALADKFGATSNQAIEAAKRAAQLKDKIGDAKALTDAFNPDQKFKALTSSLAGVAGGFAAVQGALGLFGIESKEVEKQLLKVQSAMALSQGLASIGDNIEAFKNLGSVIKQTTLFKTIDTTSTKVATVATKLFGVAVDTTAVSFKVLKGAIAATGIGLLVLALGFVIEKLITFSNASDKASEKQKELNKQLSEGAKQGVKDNEKFIDSDIKLKLARARARGASEKELLSIEQQGIKDKISVRTNAYETALKLDKQFATDISEQNSDANDQLLINDLNFKANLRKQNEAEAIKKKAEDKAAAEKLAAGQEASAKKGREFDEIRLATTEKNKIKAKEDAEDQAKKDSEFLEAEFEKENKVQEANQKKTNNIIIENERKKKSELDLFIAKKDIQNAEIDLLFGLSNILSQVAGKNRALQVAAIIAENAAGIARIIINTQVANAKAVAASPLSFGQPFVTINNISAGLGIASSLLQTRKALSQLGGGGVGSPPQLQNAASGPLQPQDNQAQLTQLNQTSINALGNQAVRAYVIETDVTNSQQRIAAIQQRARFN